MRQQPQSPPIWDDDEKRRKTTRTRTAATGILVWCAILGPATGAYCIQVAGVDGLFTLCRDLDEALTS